MVSLTYPAVLIAISCFWLLARTFLRIKQKRIDCKREAQLLLVYICIVVVVRFTFFPFSKVDGMIQPLVLDAAKVFPFRINLVPFVMLMDYPELRNAILNLVGNFTMFIPLGIVWPVVFRQLNTHRKAIAAGVGTSLCIEILQLPFYDRVTDVDDLILNSLGFLTGYAILLLVKKIRRAAHP